MDHIEHSPSEDKTVFEYKKDSVRHVSEGESNATASRIRCRYE